VPEFVALTEEQTANLEDLSALSAIPPPAVVEDVPVASAAVLPVVEEGLEEFDTSALPLR
jgi:hypothetical protein